VEWAKIALDESGLGLVETLLSFSEKLCVMSYTNSVQTTLLVDENMFSIQKLNPYAMSSVVKTSDLER